SRMPQFIGLVGMQNISGIEVEHDRRVGRGGGGFIFPVPRLMCSVRRVSWSVAGGGRVDCDRYGGNADHARVKTPPCAPGQMICCQLEPPDRAPCRVVQKSPQPM